MTTPAKQECALWYWRYQVVYYEICGSEADAARFAVATEEHGDGVPIGVQFPDGRTVRVNDWPAYDEAQRTFWAVDDASAEAARAERPTRQITDPFKGQQLAVDADEPSWLGKP